jgi:putative molybdopterin biosynthesis protein
MARSSSKTFVRAARERANLAQAALAARVGISRQALSAIEAGRVDPALSIALRLSSELHVRVEELFAAAAPPALVAELASPAALRANLDSHVVATAIGRRWVAHAPDADAIGTGFICNAFARPAGKRRVHVELTEPHESAREVVLLAGCAPVLGVLAQRLNSQKGPGRFLWLHRSSHGALRALAERTVHVAGVHLPDESAEPNVASVRRKLPGREVRLFTLVEWRAGLLVAPGNPLGVRSAGDLARKHLRIAAREPGSGARLLLERQLEAAGVSSARALQRALIVHSQFDVGRALQLQAADTGLAMEASALAYGLDFLPVAEERFDLVLPHDAESDPRLLRLLELLASAKFRRELACLPGYDAVSCGREVPLRSARPRARVLAAD